MSKKVYQIITDLIIEELKKGVIPWRKPWKAGEWPKNFKTKKRYRGINVPILASKNYISPYWLTFKQVNELGGRIKKGEKGTVIVFWRLLEVKGDEEDSPEVVAEEEKRFIPLLRYYRVWNLEQTEGIEYEKEHKAKKEIEILDEAERIISDMPDKPIIKFGGKKAFYTPSTDTVQIPEREYFHSVTGFYGTIFHELGHSTGHQKRLNRPGISNFDYFGSHQYSKEELVAEMTAAFLLGHLGFWEDPEIKNSAAYIDGWLEKLEKDPRFVVQAAAQAQKAVDYILNVKTEDEAEDDEE